MASRAETKKKQIEKKAKAANLSVAEYKKAILGQGDSALAKRVRSRRSKVETGAKVAAGIGTMFIPGFGTVALGAKALKAFSAPMKLSKVKKLGGKIRKNPTKAQIKNAKNVSPEKIIKKAEQSKIKKLDLTKSKPKAKTTTKSKPTTKAKTPEKQPSRLEKIVRTTTRIGVTKGRRTGEALRSKTGRLSGIKKKDIRLGENIRRGAGAGAASVALKETNRTR
jgi:nicotinic acid phosphoribosyltransferase